MKSLATETLKRLICAEIPGVKEGVDTREDIFAKGMGGLPPTSTVNCSAIIVPAVNITNTERETTVKSPTAPCAVPYTVLPRMTLPMLSLIRNEIPTLLPDSFSKVTEYDIM